jgi:hypothetical protein
LTRDSLTLPRMNAGANAPVLFQPDVTALGVPAAAILILAVAALAAEARTLRRRGIAGILRAN